LFPRMARIMDKLAIIRSMVGANGDHYAAQCLTGRDQRKGIQPKGGWPYIGSILSKLDGAVNAAVPPAIGLSPRTAHRPWGDNGAPGCLGAAYGPFPPGGDGIKADMVLRGISLDLLRDRRALLASFHSFRGSAGAFGALDGI